MHEEELDVLGVVDEESLVAGGHHVTGLLVGTVTDGGHSNNTLETATNAVVNSLGLAPRGTDTHEPITLVTVEAVSAYCGRCQSSDLRMSMSCVALAVTASIIRRPSIRNKCWFLEQFLSQYLRVVLSMLLGASHFIWSMIEGRGYPGHEKEWEQVIGNIRFFTIGMCFLAATIWKLN